MSESNQHKLSRIRPPRVQITYDVETAGALEKKEIPFIVGIIAPLSGKSSKKAPPMPEKKFVYIDRDNFNKVLDSIAPRVAFEVDNTLTGEGKMPVSVDFKHIDDFEPVAVVKNVPDLKTLFMERSRLRDFMAKLDGNLTLFNMLLDILSDKGRRASFHDLIKEALPKIDDARLKIDQEERNNAIKALFSAQLPEDKSTDLSKLLYEGQIILEDDQIPYALELVAEFIAIITKDDHVWTNTFTELDALQEKLTGLKEKLGEAKENLDTANGNEDEDAIKTANNDLLTAQKEIEANKKAQLKLTANIDITGEINRNISYRDKRVSRQLNHIMHHEDFQAMESSWRGLEYLVQKTETSTKLKLRLLNATFDELFKDLDKAVEFDQSALFKLVYEEEYGTYGGFPYSVLIGDFQLGRTSQDIQFLEMISGVAASAHAPFIASAYAKLFDMDDYANLYKPRDLSKIFESAELIKWSAFRESEDSRYVTLTLPKVMIREPYHHENNPVEGIYFDEDVAISEFVDDGSGNMIIATEDKDGVIVEKTKKMVDAKKILWTNPAYILGQRITNAFSLYGWTAAIRGVEGGGLIEGLPAYTFDTEDGDTLLNCPTQVSITDRREKELNDLGFMTICHCKGTNKAAFFGGQTTNKPKEYLTDYASSNARISSMLPYIMAASRFAHYIKVIMREKIGSFMTRENVEMYLNTWIAQYVLLDDTPPQHIKAKFPLREARIDVTDIPGKPGSYRAIVFLKPHFQLEELTTSIRLVADLPS